MNSLISTFLQSVGFTSIFILMSIEPNNAQFSDFLKTMQEGIFWNIVLMVSLILLFLKAVFSNKFYESIEHAFELIGKVKKALPLPR